MLKLGLHKDSSFTPPESQNCHMGGYKNSVTSPVEKLNAKKKNYHPMDHPLINPDPPTPPHTSVQIDGSSVIKFITYFLFLIPYSLTSLFFETTPSHFRHVWFSLLISNEIHTWQKWLLWHWWFPLIKLNLTNLLQFFSKILYNIIWSHYFDPWPQMNWSTRLTYHAYPPHIYYDHFPGHKNSLIILDSW